MNRLVSELKDAGIFYVATAEGDQPRVRPFSSVTEYEGHLYLCTNNRKDVYRQLSANEKVEICALNKGSWVRIRGKLVRDDRDEARRAMLADPTGPSSIYKIGDGIFEVLRLEDVHAMKYSMTAAPEVITE